MSRPILEPIRYEIGGMHIVVEDPLSEAEMIKFRLTAEERRDAQNIPGFAQQVRKRWEPKAAPVAAPEVIRSHDVVTHEDIHQAQRSVGSAILRIVARVVSTPVFKRLGALEAKTATLADAAKVAEYDARISALNTKIEKLQQTLSAQTKHVQALERKIGELIHAK